MLNLAAHYKVPPSVWLHEDFIYCIELHKRLEETVQTPPTD
jgi:hypothetical protein